MFLIPIFATGTKKLLGCPIKKTIQKKFTCNIGTKRSCNILVHVRQKTQGLIALIKGCGKLTQRKRFVFYTILI